MQLQVSLLLFAQAVFKNMQKPVILKLHDKYLG